MESPVDRTMSKGLAWFSLGLGAAELFAPNALSRVIGLKPNPGLMRALGMREIASGVAMLARPQSPRGPSARMAGDIMDLAVLGTAPRRRRGRNAGLTIAIAAIVAVAAVDLLASQRLAGQRH